LRGTHLIIFRFPDINVSPLWSGYAFFINLGILFGLLLRDDGTKRGRVASFKVVSIIVLIWAFIGGIISYLLNNYFQVQFMIAIMSYNLISLILFIPFVFFRMRSKIFDPSKSYTRSSDTIPTRNKTNNFSDKYNLEEDPSDDSRRIPSEVKKVVWERDQGQCVICKSKRHLHYDHDIPVSKGGDNSVKNIRILCRDCNLRKSDKIE